MEIIDVTLRESIYYESGLTHEDRLEYLRSICENVSNEHVQIVEIGYIDNMTEGELNYDGDYLYEARQICGKKFALAGMMHIDQSDPSLWDQDALKNLDMVRIMINKNNLDGVKEYIAYFHALGIKVSVNKIYAASVPVETIIEMEKEADRLGADCFYCADSSGSFTPVYVAELSKALMANKGSMQIGLHLHDHMQLALANAMIAHACGIEMTDVSITGAGKGGGNLKMEQALLVLFGSNAQNLETVVGQYRLMTCFNGLVSKDNHHSVQGLFDFLTGIFKFNLKKLAKLEAEANGDAQRYLELVFEGV